MAPKRLLRHAKKTIADLHIFEGIAKKAELNGATA